MKVKKWKKELVKAIDEIEIKYDALLCQVRMIDEIDEDVDDEEISAFLLLKLRELNASVDRMVEDVISVPAVFN